VAAASLDCATEYYISQSFTKRCGRVTFKATTSAVSFIVLWAEGPVDL